jgi:hypothetical protein
VDEGLTSPAPHPQENEKNHRISLDHEAAPDCSGRDKRGFARLARAMLWSERAVRASSAAYSISAKRAERSD